jgi:hypothetical protein
MDFNSLFLQLDAGEGNILDIDELVHSLGDDHQCPDVDAATTIAQTDAALGVGADDGAAGPPEQISQTPASGSNGSGGATSTPAPNDDRGNPEAFTQGAKQSSRRTAAQLEQNRINQAKYRERKRREAETLEQGLQQAVNRLTAQLVAMQALPERNQALLAANEQMQQKVHRRYPCARGHSCVVLGVYACMAPLHGHRCRSVYGQQPGMG